MAKFRKKPVVIEAFQWRGCLTDSPFPMPLCRRSIMGDGPLFCPQCDTPWHEHTYVETMEGAMTACPGDWIITGINGERYPCKPDIFEATYERVES